MNRAEKTQAIAEMAATIGKAPHAFLIEYTGLSVPDVTELRRQIRGTGSRYVVVDAAHDRVLVGNPVLPSVVVLPIDAPAERRVVTDVPVGVRAFAFAGERAFYSCRCGIYELDVSRGRRVEREP